MSDERNIDSDLNLDDDLIGVVSYGAPSHELPPLDMYDDIDSEQEYSGFVEREYFDNTVGVQSEEVNSPQMFDDFLPPYSDEQIGSSYQSKKLSPEDVSDERTEQDKVRNENVNSQMRPLDLGDRFEVVPVSDNGDFDVLERKEEGKELVIKKKGDTFLLKKSKIMSEDHIFALAKSIASNGLDKPLTITPPNHLSEDDKIIFASQLSTNLVELGYKSEMINAVQNKDTLGRKKKVAVEKEKDKNEKKKSEAVKSDLPLNEPISKLDEDSLQVLKMQSKLSEIIDSMPSSYSFSELKHAVEKKGDIKVKLVDVRWIEGSKNDFGLTYSFKTKEGDFISKTGSSIGDKNNYGVNGAKVTGLDISSVGEKQYLSIAVESLINDLKNNGDEISIKNIARGLNKEFRVKLEGGSYESCDLVVGSKDNKKKIPLTELNLNGAEKLITPSKFMSKVEGVQHSQITPQDTKLVEGGDIPTPRTPLPQI